MQLVVANSAVSIYLILMSGTVSDWLSFSPVTRLSILSTHVMAAVIIYFSVLGLTWLRPSHFRGQVKE